MSLFANLRLLVFARRSAVALERLAAATERLASVAELSWTEAHPIPKYVARGKPPVEFGSFDSAEAERRWRQRRAELMLDVEEGE
jgi:hypothetical protein